MSVLENSKINRQPPGFKTRYISPMHWSLSVMQDFPIEVNFICTNARIFVTTDTTTHADVDIKLKSSVFLQLMQGEDLTELIRLLIVSNDFTKLRHDIE
jgi:hypothetical protein